MPETSDVGLGADGMRDEGVPGKRERSLIGLSGGMGEPLAWPGVDGVSADLGLGWGVGLTGGGLSSPPAGLEEGPAGEEGRA